MQYFLGSILKVSNEISVRGLEFRVRVYRAQTAHFLKPKPLHSCDSFGRTQALEPVLEKCAYTLTILGFGVEGSGTNALEL